MTGRGLLCSTAAGVRPGSAVGALARLRRRASRCWTRWRAPALPGAFFSFKIFFLTQNALLDAEAQEVLDGVKQPVPLSEAVTEAERHSVDVGDTDAVFLPVLDTALVAEEEGDTEKEKDVEPLRVPVMLCVIVRDTESLTVTVGDTE